MHMSNYKYTVGELIDILHEGLALGADPDTPVYVRQAGANMEIQTVGVGRDFFSLYVQDDPVAESEGKNAKPDWKTVDWSKPTSVIANELGVKPPEVSKARRQYAKHTLRPHKRRYAPSRKRGK